MLNALKKRIGSEMPILKKRFTSETVSQVSKGSLTGYSLISPADMRDLRLRGDVYKSRQYGGALSQVLQAINPAGKPISYANLEYLYPITEYANFVPTIVKFYSNSLSGPLGDNVKAVQRDGQPLSEAVQSALESIWRWSNLDTLLETITATAANQKYVGLRVVYESGDNPRVYIADDDPRLITDIRFDSRRNVTRVVLEYQTVEDDDTTIEWVETIDRDSFSLLKDGNETLEPEDQINGLGVCPYVVIAFDSMGMHAYQGVENAIDSLNFALTQLDEATRASVWPIFMTTSPADIPKLMKIGKNNFLHAKTREGSPTATFDAITPQLQFGSVMATIESRVNYIRERQPQLLPSSVQLISSTSGEQVQKLMKPAEMESLRFRSLAEHGLIRAIQLAMSVGIYHSLWNLGTGVGTSQAADAAYDDGQGVEAFQFEKRPALPLTTYDRTQAAIANTAEESARYDLAAKAKNLGLPKLDWLKLAGFSDDQARVIAAEMDNGAIL